MKKFLKIMGGLFVVIVVLAAMGRDNAPKEIKDAKAAEVKKEVAPQFVTDKYSDAEMMMLCEESIKKRLKFPSTYDQDFLDNIVSRKDGRVAVVLNFEAKNAIGNVLPQRGTCLISADGQISPPDIANR